MSKKANTRLIGIFVLGAVALLVAGIMIFGSGRFFQKKNKYVLFFEGSIKGLTVGAPVILQGVQVGSVVAVKVLFNPELFSFTTPVYVELLPESIANVKEIEKVRETYQVKAGAQKAINILVQRGLRAKLEMQSLVTGKLLVALDFDPGTPAHFVGYDKTVPEIPTIPSPMKELAKKMETKVPELVEKVTDAVAKVEQLISSPELEESITSLNLALKEAGKLFQHMDGEVKPLSVSIQRTLGDTRKLVRNADGQVTRLGDSLVDTAGEAQVALKQVEATLKQADHLLVTLDEDFLGDRSAVRYAILEALQELSEAGRSIRLLAESLEQEPDALLRGKHALGGK